MARPPPASGLKMRRVTYGRSGSPTRSSLGQRIPALSRSVIAEFESRLSAVMREGPGITHGRESLVVSPDVLLDFRADRPAVAEGSILLDSGHQSDRRARLCRATAIALIPSTPAKRG
jgi:hypothetical protein